jgi:hypothetical protein
MFGGAVIAWGLAEAYSRFAWREPMGMVADDDLVGAN